MGDNDIMGKIDRAIVSYDIGSDYGQFEGIVVDAWNQIGIRPVVVGINPDEQAKFRIWDCGAHDKISVRAIPEINIGTQAQIVRYFAATLFYGETCILSDMDMLPLSESYFQRPAMSNTCDRLIVYSSDAYKIAEEGFPVCYLAGSGRLFAEILGGNLMDFPEHCARWIERGFGWRTDEKAFYEVFKEWHNRGERMVKFLRRGFSNFRVEDRIDRGSGCAYDPHLLRGGYYKDFHMPRPFEANRSTISEIYNLSKESR